MSEIIRHEINEECGYSGMVEAGGFIYTSFCACDGVGTSEEQINRVFDHLEYRLKALNLGYEHVVKLDAMFQNVWDIPVMEKIIKERFDGRYPARKSFQTNFASPGLLFQMDAVLYRG